jgi:hypothetical protein
VELLGNKVPLVSQLKNKVPLKKKEGAGGNVVPLISNYTISKPGKYKSWMQLMKNSIIL